MSWPVSWPIPQRAPTVALSIGLRPIESGANAARWSTPDSVCKQPARNPVHALLNNPWRTTAASPTALLATGKLAKAGSVKAGWRDVRTIVDISNTFPILKT